MPKHHSAILVLLLFALGLSGCSSIISTFKSEPYVENAGKRTTGSFLDDEIIETKALVNIKTVDPALASANINIASFNGIVLLTGQVNSESLRQKAAEAVNLVGNIRRLHNEIAVSGTTSLVARSNDSWITSKVKTKMLFKRDLESGRIKVVTENGVVYLMGLVTREEADRAAEAARTTAGVQKVVRIFEYI